MVQQLHQSRAMTTSQNRDTMSKPGWKGPSLDDTYNLPHTSTKSQKDFKRLKYRSNIK